MLLSKVHQCRLLPHSVQIRPCSPPVHDHRDHSSQADGCPCPAQGWALRPAAAWARLAWAPAAAQPGPSAAGGRPSRVRACPAAAAQGQSARAPPAAAPQMACPAQVRRCPAAAASRRRPVHVQACPADSAQGRPAWDGPTLLMPARAAVSRCSPALLLLHRGATAPATPLPQLLLGPLGQHPVINTAPVHLHRRHGTLNEELHLQDLCRSSSGRASRACS